MPPRLFFQGQIFQNRNRDLSSEIKCSESKSETKFSKTETETFFLIPNFLLPKPKPSKNLAKVSRPKPRLFIETKFSEPETDTFYLRPNSPKPKPSKNWQKSQNREVLKPKCQSLQPSTAQYSPIQPNRDQYNLVQSRTAQYSLVLPRRAYYSPFQNRAAHYCLILYSSESNACSVSSDLSNFKNFH